MSSYGGIYKFSISTKTTSVMTYERSDGNLIDCIGTYQNSSNTIYNFFSEQSASSKQIFLLTADLTSDTVTNFYQY